MNFFTWLFIESEDQVVEGISTTFSADGEAPASKQIALFNLKTGHCKRLLTVKMKSALAHNISASVLKDLLRGMQNQLEELASLNADKVEPYQQLITGKVLTDEAVSSTLMQNEASGFWYRADVAKLRNRLRASSPTGREATAAPLFLANFGAVLQILAHAPPHVLALRAPQLEHPLISDNSKNEFACREFNFF